MARCFGVDASSFDLGNTVMMMLPPKGRAWGIGQNSISLHRCTQKPGRTEEVGDSRDWMTYKLACARKRAKAFQELPGIDTG
jgi:hypothetical protein